MFSAFTVYLETENSALIINEILKKDDVRAVFPSFLIENMDKNGDRGFFIITGIFNITPQGEDDRLILPLTSHFMISLIIPK